MFIVATMAKCLLWPSAALYDIGHLRGRTQSIFIGRLKGSRIKIFLNTAITAGTGIPTSAKSGIPCARGVVVDVASGGSVHVYVIHELVGIVHFFEIIVLDENGTV
jgi:hypothetical protein